MISFYINIVVSLLWFNLLHLQKYHGKNRLEIDEDLCMARVWHSILGPVQCSRKKIKDDNIINVVNLSINQTLSRTLLTSFFTIFLCLIWTCSTQPFI